MLINVLIIVNSTQVSKIVCVGIQIKHIKNKIKNLLPTQDQAWLIHK